MPQMLELAYLSRKACDESHMECVRFLTVSIAKGDSALRSLLMANFGGTSQWLSEYVQSLSIKFIQA